MFKNVGNKIKVVSVLLLIAGILLSAYIGVFGHMLSGGSISSNADELILGAVIIVAGIIASIILSLIVNGFGVIVENAEKLEEIQDLVLEIKNKQTDFRGTDKKSASILNSSFNNEVFDDREFSSDEPAAPEYVKPVSGHEVAGAKYVAPTYSGHGSEHPTRPVFGTQNVGVESIKNPIDVDFVPEPPARNVSGRGPIRPGRTAAQNEAPITSAFEEPDFDEPVPQPVKKTVPQYEAPVTSAFEEPDFDEPIPQPVRRTAPQYEAPAYQAPVQETPVYEEPVYEEPVHAAPVYEEPTYKENAYEEPEEYDEPGVYASPEVPAAKVLTPEEQARANQIQELIFKFVARRNGNVNINDILRTVPRNVEPSEFQDAVKALEMQGKLVKNEAGDFTAIK